MAAVLAYAKRLRATDLCRAAAVLELSRPRARSRRRRDARPRRARRHRRGGRSPARRRSACTCARMRRTDAPSPVAGVEVVRTLDALRRARRPRRARRARDVAHAPPPRRRMRSRRMKPGVHIVNIARGALIDQDALRAALDDGTVAMASLDTVDPEPLPAGHWMYAHPKVRLTAHVSWYTPELLRAVARHPAREPRAAISAANRCCTSSTPTRATECRPSAGCRGRRHRVRLPRPRAGVAQRRLRCGRARRARRSNAPPGGRSGSAFRHACTSLDDALALPGVDAVTIATPPDTHAPLAIEACDAGRHVMCEKPFALDAAEAAQMLRRRAARGRHASRRARVPLGGRSGARRPRDRDGLIGEPRTFSLVQYVPLVADPERACRSGGSTHRAAAVGSARPVRTSSTSCARGSARSRRCPRRCRRSAIVRDGAEDSFVVRITNGERCARRDAADGASWCRAWSGSRWSPAPAARSRSTSDGVWLSNRDGRRQLAVPDDLVLPPPPIETADPASGTPISSSGPTRGCARRSGPVSAETPQTGAVPLPTFADGLAEMRGARRDPHVGCGRWRGGGCRRVGERTCMCSSRPTDRHNRSRPRAAPRSCCAALISDVADRRHRDPRRRRRWHRGFGVLARRDGRALEAGASGRARRARSHGRGAHDCEVDKRVEVGDVAGTICRVAEDLGVDVIVVGSHGRTGVAAPLPRLDERACRAARAVPGARRAGTVTNGSP